MKIGPVTPFKWMVERNKPKTRPVSFYFPALFPHNTAIYALIDPKTHEIHYVGRTKDPVRRLRSHIRSGMPHALAGNRPGRHPRFQKEIWIGRLLSQNRQPILEIIEYVPENLGPCYEQYWIRTFKRLGYRLFNQIKANKGKNR